MWLVGIGLLLFVLHALDIGPPGRWNLELLGDLWKFLVPFGLAAVWWAVSDSTGLTQRRAIEKMEKRKLQRRERDMQNLGLDTTRQRQVDKTSAEARKRAATMHESNTRRPEPPGRDPRL
jgi:small Trp-rich protein